MKTYLNPPIIWNFAIVLLLGGLSIILVPSSEAFGEQRVSERECQRTLDRVIKARNLRPDRRTYERAMRYCQNGNTKRAVALLHEAKDQAQPPKLTKKECQRTLDRAIKARNLRPDRRTYQRAMRYCQNGNTKRAVALLHEAKDQDQPAKLTKEECQKMLDKANENHNRRVDRRTYATAMNRCLKGDYKGALAVLRKAG